MYQKPIIAFVLTLFCSSSFSQETNFKTSADLRHQQVKNIHNPKLWDMERMKEDIIPEMDHLPLKFGAYPVPHYNTLGPYRGGGFTGNVQARSKNDYKLTVKGKEVVFNSFFIGDSPFYEETKRDRVFFTLITVVDSIDTQNHVPGMALMSSRNHPDYGGEGCVITKTNRIDYVAFTTPDKGSFAIVNMRLFHLEHGSTIIVAPQKDGSLRSLQVKTDEVGNKAVFNHLKNSVLQREDVVQFLTAEGVI